MRKSKYISAVLVLLSVCTLAFGQTLSQQKEKRSRIERDMAILRQQISGNQSQSDQALSAITLLQAQQKTRQELLRESDREISAIDGDIRSIRAEVRQRQEQLDTLESRYSRLVMGAYKNRDIKLWYMYILASENMSQAFRRFAYFKNLSRQISSQAKEIERQQELLNQSKARLLQARTEAVRLRKERADELQRLKQDEQQQRHLVTKLKKDKKAYQASLRAKQLEINAIDKQIAKMIAAASSGNKTDNGKSQKPKQEIDYVLDKNFVNNKGKLPWPVDGPVTEHFGPYQNKSLRLSLFNNGINIACEPDSPIHCVFDGVVANVMVAPGYGQCILVQHGSYYTSYCKVKNATVRQGDKVSTGQILGQVSTIMGKTQLYFLVYKKKYLDPEQWLRDR